MAQTSQDRNPSPDLAEDNAFFPSPYSLSQYTASKTDFDGTDYPTPYIGHKKVLMVASDERYCELIPYNLPVVKNCCQSASIFPFNTRGNLCCAPIFPFSFMNSIKLDSGKISRYTSFNALPRSTA